MGPKSWRDQPIDLGRAVPSLIGNLLADISYALADPRIRKG